MPTEAGAGSLPAIPLEDVCLILSESTARSASFAILAILSLTDACSLARSLPRPSPPTAPLPTAPNCRQPVCDHSKVSWSSRTCLEHQRAGQEGHLSAISSFCLGVGETNCVGVTETIVFGHKFVTRQELVASYKDARRQACSVRLKGCCIKMH